MIEQSLKRTSGVPRGILRFIVLRLLEQKPMSGAEISEEIERETSGKWKPSPGSIYPLLARLQDRNYTKELPIDESGMKRYVLTDRGKTFFNEQVKLGQAFLEKLEWLAPMLIGGFQFGANHQKLIEARESAKRVLETFLEFQAIKDKLKEQDVDEIVKILNASDRQLKKIARRIKQNLPA